MRSIVFVALSLIVAVIIITAIPSESTSEDAFSFIVAAVQIEVALLILVFSIPEFFIQKEQVGLRRGIGIGSKFWTFYLAVSLIMVMITVLTIAFWSLNYFSIQQEVYIFKLDACLFLLIILSSIAYVYHLFEVVDQRNILDSAIDSLLADSSEIAFSEVNYILRNSMVSGDFGLIEHFFRELVTKLDKGGNLKLSNEIIVDLKDNLIHQFRYLNQIESVQAHIDEALTLTVPIIPARIGEEEWNIALQQVSSLLEDAIAEKNTMELRRVLSLYENIGRNFFPQCRENNVLHLIGTLSMVMGAQQFDGIVAVSLPRLMERLRLTVRNPTRDFMTEYIYQLRHIATIARTRSDAPMIQEAVSRIKAVLLDDAHPEDVRELANAVISEF